MLKNSKEEEVGMRISRVDKFSFIGNKYCWVAKNEKQKENWHKSVENYGVSDGRGKIS